MLTTCVSVRTNGLFLTSIILKPNIYCMFWLLCTAMPWRLIAHMNEYSLLFAINHNNDLSLNAAERWVIGSVWGRHKSITKCPGLNCIGSLWHVNHQKNKHVWDKHYKDSRGRCVVSEGYNEWLGSCVLLKQSNVQKQRQLTHKTFLFKPCKYWGVSTLLPALIWQAIKMIPPHTHTHTHTVMLILK